MQSLPTPTSFFDQQMQAARQAERAAQRQFNSLSLGRLGTFAAVPISISLWDRSDDAAWGVLTLLATVLYLVLMRRQQAARRRREFARNLQTINTDELERLNFQFRRKDTGEHFLDLGHPYAADLDLFGKHSLYRLLNRTRTDEGSRRLARWLTRHAELDEIMMRQESVTEFQKQAEWRQAWEATALLHEHAAQQVGTLRAWAKETMEVPLRQSLRWRWWPVVTLLLGTLALTSTLPAWPFWLSLVWQAVILNRYNAGVQSLTSRTTDLGLTLLAYADLLQLAHDAPFQTRWWQLRRSLIQQAAPTLRTLGHWFARLDYRLHPFFLIFVGIPFLWDLHCLAALEAWKERHQAQLDQWLEVLADTEAMNSLAGFAFAQPNYPLPQVTWEQDVRVEAEALAHPLIPASKRVSNDFNLHGTGTTVLITGSNMSGKSTFLRTLGINLVLAQMGAVVCARRLACSPVQVFSSMRTQDSLEESTSSFYAELKRLRQLIELSQSTSGSPIFYLLDEILKGTNSADRHRGAEALIRQLHPKQAAGLVSTHDLELGEWGATQPYVHNYHFRSDVQDGALTFNYQLQEGICQSFNASELMRMMGIELDP